MSTATVPPTCPNLKALFGNHYKVVFEESYYAERPEYRAAEAPWLMLIRGANPANHVYPHGPDTLAVFVVAGSTLAKQVETLDFTKLHTDGSDGATFLFPVGRFAEVAQIIRARRRRVVSEAERERLAVMGAKTQFRHGYEPVPTARI